MSGARLTGAGAAAARVAQEPPQTLTVPQVAAIVGVSEWAVYTHIRAGDFPIPHLTVGRKILFARAAVDAVLGRSEAHPEVTALDEGSR